MTIDAPRRAPERRSSLQTGLSAFGRWCGRRGVELWLPVALLLVWFLLSRGSTDVFLPPLTDILGSLREDFLTSAVLTNLLPSLGRLLLGLGLAVLLGVAVGYVVGLTRTARTMLLPVLDIFRSTPVVALIPVFIALFGIGSFSEILLIAWAAFWPILLGTVAGVAAVDTGFRDTATALRMSWRQKLVMVRLPAAAPHVFAGINLAVSISVTAMVAIELFTASHGLGRYLALSKIGFDMTAAYAGALAAGCVGFGAAKLFSALERNVFMKWHHERGERADDV
ncbi:ABC transporter permease subunit [Saccharomonospora sp. NPDC046836]|uniref:ABC transporter permease n=1 Tax=Saccharomonospora sp. NPDC046836 TaxID=3156921 RepID=UPI0033CCBE07